jgi:hypothetical protein
MNDTRLREGLLAAETPSPDLEQHYRERLKALVERKLTAAQRASHLFGLIIGLILVARFIQLFLQERAAGRPVALTGIALGLAFSAAWVIASASVLQSGVDRFFTHTTARAWLVTGFTFLLAGVMLWAGLTTRDAAEGLRLIVFGLVFWCAIGLPFLLSHLMGQSERRLRADVLRLELMMARRLEPGSRS